MLSQAPGQSPGTLSPNQRQSVLRAVDLSKSFPPTKSSLAAVHLFRGLKLDLFAGELVAVVGRSGVGKSSLLHLLAAGRAARMRNEAFGFVWQFHYFLPEFTAVENVAMPLMARGVRRRTALLEAETWLARVELTGRSAHRSGELSGGEQQRVAIARALITGPRVLLADEPTGDLDETTAFQLFLLLERLSHEGRLATLIATHNLDLARRCNRTLLLRDGRLEVTTNP